MAQVYVDPTSFFALKAAFEGAGNQYLNNYQRLTAVVENIENGSIKGPVATEFQRKYEEKKELFDSVKKAIDTVHDGIQEEETNYSNKMDNIMSSMR